MTRPLPAFNFQVEWNGNVMGFTEVSGLGVEIGVIEYREGNDREAVTRKIPGLRKFTNVTLKRGVLLEDNGLFEWLDEIEAGTAQRRDVTISLLDEDHQPTVQWRLRNALPVRYGGPSLAAGANRVAIEELEIDHEGLVVGRA